MKNTSPDDYISWENLIYVTDFLIASGKPSLSLMGGEPMLHPHLGAFIKYLVLRGLYVSVFTSGLGSTTSFKNLKKGIRNINTEWVNLVVNYNNPNISPDAESSIIETFFNEFSKWISLSINVYKLGFDYSYVIDAINRFNLRRNVRIGLAHPLTGVQNNCIKPDRDSMGGMVSEFLNAIDSFEEEGITVMMDCGFPLCAFSDKQLGRLYRHNPDCLRFSCSPAIDIAPDLSVWNCFPLSEYHTKSLLDFNDYTQLKEYFQKLSNHIHDEKGGIFKECKNCKHRHRNICAGGCLTHALTHSLV